MCIRDRFIAGIAPGVVLVLLFAIIVYAWGRIRPMDVPPAEQAERIGFGHALYSVLPIVLVGAVITVSIYGGIATPTEAAAIAALLTVALAFAMGGLSLKGLVEALLATMRTMGYLGLLLSAGVLFGFVTTYYRIPQQVTALFLTFELSPYWVLFIVIMFYLILGMFMEPTSMTFITLPTVFPLVQAAGFDLIWFGIVYTLTMEIAVLTPPVGLNLYVIQGIGGRAVTIDDVIMGCLPFIAAMVVLIAMLILAPPIALWLPGVMR